MSEPTNNENRSRLYWVVFNSYHGIKNAVVNFVRKHWLISSLAGIALVSYLFVLRAAYQPVFLFARKYTLLLLLFLLISYGCYLLVKKGKWIRRLVVGVVYIAFVITSITLGKSIHEYVSLYLHYNAIEKYELSELPITSNERIQPLNAIKTLAKQEALSTTESATHPYFIVRKDGTLDFSMAVGPSREYFVQRLTKNMHEVISVPATQPSPDFSGQRNRFPVSFDVGELMLFSKESHIAAVKRLNIFQYFSYEPTEVRFVEDDEGNWVQVILLQKWKGWFFPRPVFGGVIVIEQGPQNPVLRSFFGVGEFVHADDISGIPYLNKQDLLPVEASRFTAESFRFQNGFFAPMPGYHEGDIRVPDLPDDQNEQPFVTWFNFEGTGVQIKEGLYNYFGLEPFDPTKRGLNTSLFIPGNTSEVVYYIDHDEKQDGLIGCSAIPPKILESKKNYDWSKNKPVEFRPYIKEIDGSRKFFWLSTVVTISDSAGTEFIGGRIPEVTITDARFGQVVWIDRATLGETDKWPSQVENEMQHIWE